MVGPCLFFTRSQSLLTIQFTDDSQLVDGTAVVIVNLILLDVFIYICCEMFKFHVVANILYCLGVVVPFHTDSFSNHLVLFRRTN